MREFRLFIYTLAFVTVTAASLSACAQIQATRTAGEVIYNYDKDIASLPVRRTFSGSYLAGRFAQRQQDWDSAQIYMGNVLSYHPQDAQLEQRTFLLALGAGNYSKARELAQNISSASEENELALIFMGCDAINRKDFATALEYLKKLPEEGFGQYTKPLLTAWTLAGQGKKSAAMKILLDNTPASDATYHMHIGMLEEMTGDMNAAAQHYKIVMENGLNLHSALMVANFFERYGQPEITQQIYQELDALYPFNPFIGALKSRDPHRTISPNIVHAADGAAFALFDLATLLYEKHSYDGAQIYGSLTRLLDSTSPFAKLMMGDIAVSHKQYDEALENYNAISETSPIYWLSRIRIAETYEASGQIERSINMLTLLAKDPATRTQALVSLGDTYRQHGQFENAVHAYNQALTDISPITEKHWPIIYARGIAEERLNRWDLAERDLLQALKFQPNNPTILNFIAYSWANQGVKLGKALEYVKHAAALRPNDAYILDSYGWTLFHLSQYKESIVWLEQAVGQLPNDTTLLDHLGDAYWQIGRQNEARHQWQHAHDLSQDPAFRVIAQKKMQHGITVPSQVARKDDNL